MAMFGSGKFQPEKQELSQAMDLFVVSAISFPMVHTNKLQQHVFSHRGRQEVPV